MSYICGQIEVFLEKGDITEMETDAIVNAANNHLWMGAGVAGAIKKKGGKIIEDEAVKKGPIPVGEALATTAGALKAKYVIHAAGMGQDLTTDAEKIYSCTLNSLKRTRELGLKSIAFPAIGTGVGGFSLEVAAGSMIKAVIDHAEAGADSPETVSFVLFQQGIYNVFQEAADKLLTRQGG
jgi:O-acetyl-ADP-ribose deacetylase (regulator of RNase III)